MADYFTNVSFILDLPRIASEWLERLLEVIEPGDQSDPELHEIAKEVVAKADHNEGYLGVEWRLEYHKDGTAPVWIYGTESPNLHLLAVAIQATLRKFRPERMVGFEWSNDSTKARTDAFGGGAVAITADEILFCPTSAWLQDEFLSHPGNRGTEGLS